MNLTRRYATGYYVRGTTAVSGKIHVHDYERGRPVCGATLHPLARFLWCATWICEAIITCRHCLGWNLRRLSAARSAPAEDHVLTPTGTPDTLLTRTETGDPPETGA